VSLFFRARPETVWFWWGSALPHIKRVLDRGIGSYTTEDVKARCESGKWTLWLCFDRNCIAAAVTLFGEYPRLRTCIIRMLGGRLPRDWRSHLTAIEDWARDEWCSAVEIFGRKGWLRHASGYGFQQIVLRKEL
jgi:hypothetical protein